MEKNITMIEIGKPRGAVNLPGMKAPVKTTLQLPGGIALTPAKLDAEYTLVGKVRTAHGLKGEVFVVFNARKADWLGSVSTISLLKETENDRGEKLPVLHDLKIKRVKPHKVGAIFLLEGIDDRNQSEALAGTPIYIPNHVLVSKDPDTVYLKEILNFKVLDETLGEVGMVVGFSSNGPQDLLVVKTTAGDFEIPFVPELTKKIRMKEKEIHMDLPEGLLSKS